MQTALECIVEILNKSRVAPEQTVDRALVGYIRNMGVTCLLLVYPCSVYPQTSISENANKKMPNDCPLKQLGLVLSYRAVASSFDARRGLSNLSLEKGHLGKHAVRKCSVG